MVRTPVQTNHMCDCPNRLHIDVVGTAGIVFMTVVAMSSLFSFQSSSSTACNTSFRVQAFLVGLLVGRMTGSLLDGGVFNSLALITEEQLVGVNVWSLMV